jgi:hypothetical protein
LCSRGDIRVGESVGIILGGRPLSTHLIIAWNSLLFLGAPALDEQRIVCLDGLPHFPDLQSDFKELLTK